MAIKNLTTLRLSALISTYGPGSIVDYRTQRGPVSCIVNECDGWDSARIISEPRLAKVLGVSDFREPPPFDEEQPERSLAALVTQFPEWLQCPKCRYIGHLRAWAPHSIAESLDRFCEDCSNHSQNRDRVYCVPVRFVAACKKGHITDFPWHYFVRHRDGCTNTGLSAKLRLSTRGSGISSIYVHCNECKSERSMLDAFRVGSFGLRCNAKSPWKLSGSRAQCECTETLKTLQRGSSSIYFANQKSAISIPPWSDVIVKELRGDLSYLLSADEKMVQEYIRVSAANPNSAISRCLKAGNISEQDLEDYIRSRAKDVHSTTEESLALEEYRILRSSCSSDYSTIDFISRSMNVPVSLQKYICGLSKIQRLREVRALCSFSRLNPTTDTQYHQPVVSTSKHWLPAVENYGEGLFIDFNTEYLLEWEQRISVRHRLERIITPLLSAMASRGEPTEELVKLLTPRFYLLHTISHILVRTLSNVCGYSSASIRERIYSIPAGNSTLGMAGILLYTASSDSDGTLGGLAGMADGLRFESYFTESISSSQWCSSDPLCITRSLDIGLNGSMAACHNCVLLPETSCAHFNKYLDRGFLFGDTADQGELGFFENGDLINL